MSKKEIKSKNLGAFEASLNQLESIIAKLESQEQSLDEALGSFEEGIRLLRTSQKTLSAAEQKVTMLLERDAQIESGDFSEIDNPE